MNLLCRVVKYVLFVVNLCCVILGGLLLTFGIWLLNNSDEVRIDHGEKLAAIVTIVLSSLVLTAAIAGCVGAFMEARDLLIGYAVTLIFLLLVQLALVSISYAATSSDGTPAGIQNGFDDLWQAQQMLSNSRNNNNSLHSYEEWLECCGKKSAEDYVLLDRLPPSSCCKDHDCTSVLNLYMIGCEQKYREYMSSKTRDFNTISWWLILIEFTGSILTCVFIDSLRDYRDRIRLYS